MDTNIAQHMNLSLSDAKVIVDLAALLWKDVEKSAEDET
jgi:hypothetical protein